MMVQDNGPGVPVSRKERIFQPFVTTKPSGMGKGLGLFIARDMAEYHGWVSGHRVAGRTCPAESHKRFRTADGVTVNYATQIIDSFKASVVERILVVDDAYDPPVLSEEHLGGLLEVLQGPALRDYVTGDESLGEEDLQSAIAALMEGELDHESINDAISALFDAYISSRQVEIDPDEQFSTLKASSLEDLDPLLELLECCGDGLCVRRVGKVAALRVCRELRPDSFSLDFFLSPPDRTTGASNPKEERADRKSSIDLLRDMLQADDEVNPAVILMSSQDVQARAQRYRSRLEGKVTALRFGFLNKNWIRRAGDGVIAEGNAADALIETSGSFEFGRTLDRSAAAVEVGGLRRGCRCSTRSYATLT